RDVVTGKVRPVLRGGKSAPMLAAFAPNGKMVLTCGRDALWSVWDIGTGGRLMSGKHREGETLAVGFLPDGKSFLLVTPKAVLYFDARTGRQVGSRALGKIDLDYPFALSDDCCFLAYQEGANALQVMDLRSGK